MKNILIISKVNIMNFSYMMTNYKIRSYLNYMEFYGKFMIDYYGVMIIILLIIQVINNIISCNKLIIHYIIILEQTFNSFKIIFISF